MQEEKYEACLSSVSQGPIIIAIRPRPELAPTGHAAFPENARRIAAALNLCRGISIEALEAMPSLVGNLANDGLGAQGGTI